MARKIANEELSRLSIPEFRKTKKIPLIIVLDDIRSMHNTGSIFRTSDAFRVEKIILCGITAVPPQKDIHKTALGATESVCWEYSDDIHKAISSLKAQNYIVLGIEQTESSIPLQHFIPEKERRYACILGHEVRGVNQDIINMCDYTIEIPQFGTKHSLNVSVCAGIVIWDLYWKLQLG